MAPPSATGNLTPSAGGSEVVEVGQCDLVEGLAGLDDQPTDRLEGRPRRPCRGEADASAAWLNRTMSSRDGGRRSRQKLHELASHQVVVARCGYAVDDQER